MSKEIGWDPAPGLDATVVTTVLNQEWQLSPCRISRQDLAELASILPAGEVQRTILQAWDRRGRGEIWKALGPLDSLLEAYTRQFLYRHKHPAFRLVRGEQNVSLAEDASEEETANSIHDLLEASVQKAYEQINGELRREGIDVIEYRVEYTPIIFWTLKAYSPHDLVRTNRIMSSERMRGLFRPEAAIQIEPTSDSLVVDGLAPRRENFWRRVYRYQEDGSMTHGIDGHLNEGLTVRPEDRHESVFEHSVKGTLKDVELRETVSHYRLSGTTSGRLERKPDFMHIVYRL